jgi:hypothetical protein
VIALARQTPGGIEPPHRDLPLSPCVARDEVVKSPTSEVYGRQTTIPVNSEDVEKPP